MDEANPPMTGASHDLFNRSTIRIWGGIITNYFCFTRLAYPSQSPDIIALRILQNRAVSGPKAGNIHLDIERTVAALDKR